MPTFATSHWGLVLAAGESGQPSADEALAELCGVYWYPIYAYVRRRGYDAPDAEDLTQGFFLDLLNGDSASRADRTKGRFRTFLLGAVNRYLAYARDQARAETRGGSRIPLPISAAGSEVRYLFEPVDRWGPDRLFERQWALAMLDQVFRRLRESETEAGRGAAFARLREFVTIGSDGTQYAHVAAEMGMSEDDVNRAVQRLRRRYDECFRQEILRTLENPSDVDEEIRYLCTLAAE